MSEQRSGRQVIADLSELPFTPTGGTKAQLKAWAAQQEAHTSGWINVKEAPYGAKGDGITDDTAAIQAAIDAARASSTAARRVWFPRGTYLVSAPLSIAPTYFGETFEGEGMNAASIKASAAMDAVFKFTDSGANSRFAFRELTIDGNSLAQAGISSLTITNSTLERVLIKGTTVTAAQMGYGWDNSVVDCEFSNNLGDGLRLPVSNANNVNIDRTRILSNAGWGVVIDASAGPVNIRGSNIENNRVGGIAIKGASLDAAGVINIRDSYFEGNASFPFTATTDGTVNVTATAASVIVAAANIGHAIYGPNIPLGATVAAASGTTITLSLAATGSGTATVRIAVGTTIAGQLVLTDILVNGTSDLVSLGGTYPYQAVNIDGNISTASSALSFVYYTGGARNLNMSGNIRTPYSLHAQTLIGFFSVYRPTGSLSLRGNDGFSGWNGSGPSTHGRVIPSYGPNVTIDLAAGTEFVIKPTNGTAFTIDSPANGLQSSSRFVYQDFTIRVRNATGGALGAITWGATYRMAAWASPATGFSRAITFTWDADAMAWVEIGRTTADVPN